MKRKVRYILARIVGVLAILILALCFALQLPVVQTKLAQEAVKMLDKVCDAEVSMSAVKIYLPGTVVIKNLLVKDKNPLIETDTLIYAETLSASIRLNWVLLGEGIHMSRVTLENAALNIVSEDTPHLANINRVLRRIPPQYPTDAKNGHIFDLSRVDVRNFHFRLKNCRDSLRRIPPYGIDFGDLDLTTTIRGHDLHFTDGLMYGTSDHCEIHLKKCGYDVANVTGNCRVGRGMTLVENIHFVDTWSDLKVRMYSMEYKSPRHLKNITTKIKLGLSLTEGNLSMKTLKQFTGNFDGNETDIEIHGGKVDGFLSNMRIKRLDIRDRNSGISGIVDGRILNIGSQEELELSARLTDFKFTTGGLDTLLAQWTNGKNPNLKKFAPGQKILLNVSAFGKVSDLSTELSVKSPSGNISAKATVKNIMDKNDPVEIKGNLVTEELALNRIIKGLPVGKLSMTSSLFASLKKPDLEFEADSIHISSIDLMKGTFKDINATAAMKKNDIYLKLRSNDPSLNFSLFGNANFKDDRHLKLAGDFRRISLDALGLKNKNNIRTISTSISADIAENRPGRVSGDISIPNIALQTDTSTVNTGEVRLKARFDDKSQNITLKCDLVNMTFSGNNTPSRFISDLKAISVEKYMPVLMADKGGKKGGDEKNKECGNYDLSVNFRRSPALLDLIIPNAFISDSTKMFLKVTSDGIMHGAMASSLIEVGALSAKKVDLSFDNSEGGLSAFLTSNEFSSGKLKFQKTKISLFAKDNCINAGFKYDNSTAESPEKANLYINGELSRDRKDSLELIAKPYLSYFNFGDNRWELDGDVKLSNGRMKFNKIALKDEDESIIIDGGWAKKGRDTVNIDIDNFGLVFIDRLLGLKLDAKGRLSGRARIVSPLGNETEIDAGFKCADATLGAVKLGDLSLTGLWDKKDRKVILDLQNTLEGHNAVSAHVDYFPKAGNISAFAKLDHMNLAMAKPMMKNIFSDMGGYINGEFSIRGSGKNMVIEEKGANLEDAMITVGYTGVTYILNGDFDIDNKSLSIKDLSIKDKFTGSGTLSGKLSFDKKFQLEANLQMNKIKVLDTPEKQNTPVYGQVETSGNINIKGSTGKFDIQADILANSPGNIHIPLNTALVGSTSDLLTFVERVVYNKDEVDVVIAKKKSEGKTALNASGRLRISKDLTAWAEIDKTTGNKMKISGDGDVKFDINSRSGQVKLNGMYSIDDGYYHFVIPGLLEKDFNIGKGSNVTLSGNVKDVALDIKAFHPVKASLATLLADTTVTSTRTAVDCVLGINGKASSPKLSFDINIPDIDPSTRAKVEAALNTEDKKQKQFMSLLVLGTFLPAEESGVVNGTNVLYSNVGEIMSGQINSIMQKLEIPVDFGFGYQQSIKGESMYDVAVSTQLFNNRVLINGSVGSRQSTGSGGSSQSSVVGDIDIAVKLDKIGKWRVNVFSRSANEYTSFIDNSQRSGVGVSYQKEFSTLKELFTTGKRAAALPPEEDNKVIIKVE